jgi:hypothetical protein
MTACAIFLLALAAADLVAGGIAGDPRTIKATASGLLAGLGVLLLLSLSVTEHGVPLAFLVFSVIAIGGWNILRLLPSLRARPWKRPVPLVWLGLSILTAVFYPTNQVSIDERFATLAASTGWPALREVAPDLGLFVVASFAVMAATANAIVREILIAAGTQIQASQNQLRGGRYIGVLERWLILGFALAGQPTAAALVVSAKGIVRFPELSATRGERASDDDAGPRAIDHVTEYFLLGSMSSWVVALLPVTLI